MDVYGVPHRLIISKSAQSLKETTAINVYFMNVASEKREMV